MTAGFLATSTFTRTTAPALRALVWTGARDRSLCPFACSALRLWFIFWIPGTPHMANSKSAIKRWHQSIKRRDRNRATRSATRSAVRTLREVATSGDEAAVKAALSQAYSSLDTAAKKGTIHTGKADRTKRRLAALVARAS
ncbi:MAG: 30S ribosomal protein S20 [Anaerolinea sp.]|nr:30S ribosomal protein S20 [Anaerolinea sp.]